MIGRWIDERCREEPDVMRRVLNRKFGDLRMFCDSDGKCGCLIGLWGLETGRASAHWIPDNYSLRREWWVGMRVFRLTLRYGCYSWRKRPDAFVIRLIKQRIRKSLGIRPVESVPEDVLERSMT